jgi:hypothetical protein
MDTKLRSLDIQYRTRGYLTYTSSHIINAKSNSRRQLQIIFLLIRNQQKYVLPTYLLWIRYDSFQAGSYFYPSDDSGSGSELYKAK